MVEQNRKQKCENCKRDGIYENLLPIPSNFGHFLSSLRVISLCLDCDDKNPTVSFAWKPWSKMTRFNFLTAITFSRNPEYHKFENFFSVFLSLSYTFF